MMTAIRILLLLLLPWPVLAQKVSGNDGDLTFKTGVYLSFSDFRDNSPVPLTHLITQLDIRSPDYLKSVLEEPRLDYYDNSFDQRSIATDKVWGYSEGNSVFVRISPDASDPQYSDWQPLLIIGAICYFPSYEMVQTIMPFGPDIGMYGRTDPMDDTYRERTAVHFLIDFSDGTMIRFAHGSLDAIDPEPVGQLLRNDAELFNEFNSMPKRQQKKQAMFFIRRYDQRHPVHFPE